MDWINDVKERYSRGAFDAFEPAYENFKRRLSQFFVQEGISIVDDNPEGKTWLVLLKDRTELFVGRWSFDTGSDELWIEYDPAHGGIVAERLGAHGSRKYHVIVGKDEILQVCETW